MTRFGFLLLLVLFGELMFVAGALAPKPLQDSVRGGLLGAGQEVANLVRSAPAPAPASAASIKPAASPAPVAAEAEEPDPVPADSLNLPAQLPDKAQYGLQLGQFADHAPSTALGKRLRVLHVPFKSFDIVDQGGQRWAVVAAGPYANADAARAARAMLGREIGLVQPMPVILLPPAPKP